MIQMGPIAVTAKNVPAARVNRHAATPVAMTFAAVQTIPVMTGTKPQARSIAH